MSILGIYFYIYIVSQNALNFNTILTNSALNHHKINLCIGSIIHDAKAAGEQTVIINIGIGTLSIDLIDMQCKFVPSKELRTAIKSSLTSSKDPLELALEQSLVEKLINICEEVM